MCLVEETGESVILNPLMPQLNQTCILAQAHDVSRPNSRQIQVQLLMNSQMLLWVPLPTIAATFLLFSYSPSGQQIYDF